MLGFLTYHAKWGEVSSNPLWIFHLCNYDYVSSAQHHLFACLLLSRMNALTILCTLLLYLSLFPLGQDASPPVFSMDILISSTSKLVKSVEFFKAPYSSTLTRFHGCCSLFNIVIMKWMMWKGAHLDAVGNTHSILIFSQTTVIMEVNSHMGVTFLKVKFHVNTGLNFFSLVESCHIFCVT